MEAKAKNGNVKSQKTSKSSEDLDTKITDNSQSVESDNVVEDDNNSHKDTESTKDNQKSNSDIPSSMQNKLATVPKSLTPIGYMTDVVAISHDLGFKNPLEYLTFMVNNSSNSITRPGDALMLYQKSRELNIGWTTALEHIYLIPTKGGTKTAISVHMAKAMLTTRSNVTWKVLKDYEPVYNYLALISGTKVIYGYNDPLPEKHKIYYTTEELKQHDNSTGYVGLIPILKDGKPHVISRVTEYEFRRIRIVNGKEHEDIVTSKFSLKDAEIAGLMKEGGNYYKYPNTMIDHRAFMTGARAIASDILLGMYAPAELDQVEGTTVLLDKEGNPIEVIT